MYKVLNNGIKKINTNHGGQKDNYTIISSSTDIKIPLNKTEDNQSQGRIIGKIPTVLHYRNHPRNLRNDQEVFVEDIIGEFKELRDFKIIEVD